MNEKREFIRFPSRPLKFHVIAMEQWNGREEEKKKKGERRKKLLKIASWKRDKRLLVPVAK